MKTLHKTLTALAMALLIGTGSLMLWARVHHRLPKNFRMTRFEMTGRALVALHNAHHAGRLGVLFVVVGIGWLATSSVFRRSDSYVFLDGAGGAVRVSVSAIAELLSRVGSDFPAVVNIRPVVSAHGDKLRVDLQCRVRAGTEVPALSRALQDRAQDTLQRGIGIGEVKAIRVTVRGIVGDLAAGSSRDAFADFNSESRLVGMSGRADAEHSPDDTAR